MGTETMTPSQAHHELAILHEEGGSQSCGDFEQLLVRVGRSIIQHSSHRALRTRGRTRGSTTDTVVIFVNGRLSIAFLMCLRYHGGLRFRRRVWARDSADLHDGVLREGSCNPTLIDR